MLWIVLTATAAPLQVARNVMQRGLVGDAGPWGATLVRFLFGLPFSLAMFGVIALLTRHVYPDPSARFWAAAIIGALAQMTATATLLVTMRRSGFAVATVMQQSSLPLGAILGWLVLDDRLPAGGWLGVVLATIGLVILSWPPRTDMRGGLTGAGFGFGSGVAFAIALNGYREAGLTFEPAHPIFSAMAVLVTAQTLQSLLLTAILAVTAPQALRAVAVSWRSSLGAGFFGSAASACWFAALALAPAGPVRAVGVIEAPIAAAAGQKLFRERLSARQWLGGALAAVGVVMTALA